MATKKTAAKKAVQKKAAGKSAPAKRATKKAASKKSVTPAKGKATKKAATKKAAAKQAETQYTRPDLRERLKKKIIAGDKGGKPGQWSARKAQLLAAEYEKAGGGYKGGEGKQQKSLQKWTDEKWHTADNKKAIRKGETARYLPDKAWSKMTATQKRATDRKKREGSKQGKQFVANTAAAKKARKSVTK